jgi:hypothetical protein
LSAASEACGLERAGAYDAVERCKVNLCRE